MSVFKPLVLMLCIVALGTLSSCSYLEKVKQSDAFTKFCAWAPVAVKGINEAANEAAKDPVKIQVAKAMREGSGYLSVVALQCEAPVMAVK